MSNKRLVYLRDIECPRPITYDQTAFLSLVRLVDGSFIAAYREFEIAKQNTNTQIRLQRYDKDFNATGDSNAIPVGGHDPRAFMWNDEPWCITSIWKGGDTADCDHVLIQLESGKKIAIEHGLEYAGKNWCAASAGGRLLIIRSLDPLSIHQFKDGKLEAIFHPSDPELQEYIGEWRCGTAFGYCFEPNTSCGFVAAIGHKTTTGPLRHIPFYFEAKCGGPSNADMVRYEMSADIEFPLMDPTSYFGDKVLICCSEKSWWEPQTIRHCLYQIVK